MKIKDHYITIIMQQLDTGMKGLTTDADRDKMMSWIVDVTKRAEQLAALVNRTQVAKIVDGAVHVMPPP